MFNKLGIKGKLAFFFIMVILIFIGSNLFIWTTVREIIMDEKKATLKNLTETAYSVILSYYNEAQSGKMKEEDAKKEALSAISRLRYGKSGYFWVNDYNGIMLMHPIKPSLVGKNLISLKDPTGREFFANLVKIAKEKGEGFEKYMWPKPGEEEPSPKLSFIKGFPKWNFIVGTGFYIDDIEATMKAMSMKMFIIVVLVIIVVIFLLLLADKTIVTNIRKAISTINDFANEIAKGRGDFTKKLPVKGNDETAKLTKAFNTLMDALKDMILKIKNTSTTLDETSTHIQSEVEKMIDASTSLASSAEETSATVEEITSSINEVANNAEDIVKSTEKLTHRVKDITSGTKKIGERADKVSENSERVKIAMNELEESISETVKSIEDSKDIIESAVKFSDEGRDAITNTISGLERIRDRMDELSNVVARLGKSSEEIGKIIDVISDIADQTNLLALNAAIEAARAGEHGKGFAVVADEVRKLAERSQQAAGEISELIRGVQGEVDAAVKSSEEGRKEVEKGTKLAEHAGEIFNKINSSIEKVTDMIEIIANNAEEEKEGGMAAKELTENNLKEINTITDLIKESVENIMEMGEETEEVSRKVSYISEATREQAAATKEMRNAVMMVSEVAQKNADTSQSLGETAEKLKGYAVELEGLVEGFKVK